MAFLTMMHTKKHVSLHISGFVFFFGKNTITKKKCDVFHCNCAVRNLLEQCSRFWELLDVLMSPLVKADLNFEAYKHVFAQFTNNVLLQ